jgi:hypothetical protein
LQYYISLKPVTRFLTSCMCASLCFKEFSV